MAKKWPGGIITKNQATPTGPYQNSSAPGIWTLNQMSYWVKQALWPTAGNINPSAFIENLFSTWLYTGNGSTQTITNGIDLSGKGGLVWEKLRNTISGHFLMDTERGGNFSLDTSSTGAQVGGTGFSFNSNGYTWASSWSSPNQVASWTFREQPKFFDVVTYTGTGANRTIAHNLGSVPGMIIVKSTSAVTNWLVYHRGLANTQAMILNSAGAVATNTAAWNSTTPTSSVFSVGTVGETNGSGSTYVAYLFAHNAGGFGLSGNDNVISCDSFTTDGSGLATVTLGYEPQYVMVKRTSASSDWLIFDTMRGLTVTNDAFLRANTTEAEVSSLNLIAPTATGFTIDFSLLGYTSASFIYIAIRRGPMQVPTLGTSVFNPNALVAPAGTSITTDFVLDFQLNAFRAGDSLNFNAVDRLRGLSNSIGGNYNVLFTSQTAAEVSNTSNTYNWWNTDYKISNNASNASTIRYSFKRAPGFFDVVCYTGDGVNARAITHNLTVAPEMIIVKNRGGGQGSQGWVVWASGLTSRLYQLYLNGTNAQFVEASPRLNVNNAPTATQFEVGTDGEVNGSGGTYVAYLFASIANVSKVGSYTGTGATQTINAGLASGARFVMIKRTDSTGNWFVWDTARGMVAGTDPRIAMNSSAAELNNNWVYTASTGFQIVTTDASVNASGGSYIYLAIA
jgi:hypothetical protein